MLKVCSNHSIIHMLTTRGGPIKEGGPGAVAPFALYKIHHCVSATERRARATVFWPGIT